MPTKIEIMATINNHADPIDLTAIASFLRANPTSMGPQISRMKKEGLLDEVVKDRYILSPQGELYLKEARDSAASILRILEPRREAGGPYRAVPVQEDEPGPSTPGVADGPDPELADSVAAEEFFESLRVLMDELKSLRYQKGGWTHTLTDLLEKLDGMTAERDVWRDRCSRWSSRIVELQDLVRSKEK